MIRLGLRLAVAGGREAIARLVVIAVAVAVGVTLLLVTIAATSAIDAQNQRSAWLETGDGPATTPAPGDAAAGDPLWFSAILDRYDGHQIGRVDVAATGPDSPAPPGLPSFPAPGQYYASPAMVRLLDAAPSDQLDDRYPGTLAGTIDDVALASPDMYLIVVGRTVEDLAGNGMATLADGINTEVPSTCARVCAAGFGVNGPGLTLVLGVVAAALLFPVLVFIGSATRLAATRRTQRFAAMRLAGATPRQVSVLSTVEAVVAAVAGVVVGFGLFAALRPAVASIPFTGEPFFPSDLSLSLRAVLGVGLGVPLAAAVAARIALQRTQIDPLSVGRRTTPAPPRAWRLIPLVAGLAELSWFAVAGRPSTTDEQLPAYLIGVLLVMTGLVLSGSWLTMAGARLLGGRANRPAGLIAGRRLGDDPTTGFRAVSGLVLALFVGSGAVATIDTVSAAATPPGERGDTVVSRMWHETPASALPDSVVASLRAVPGVRDVAVVRVNPERSPWRHGVASCADLARVPELGRCPAGAATVQVSAQFSGAVIDGAPSMARTVWEPSAVTVDELATLPLETIVVPNDGSLAAIERVRTILDGTLQQRFGAETVREANDHATRDVRQFRQLANVVIAASLLIAGCSLAVGFAGGLAERRRPFSLLRLSGVPLSLLRRVVLLETVVPLVVTAVAAAGLGFLTAHLFVRAQMERSVTLPGAAYWVVVGIGLAASIAVMLSTLPLLRRLTGPEAARSG